MAVWYITCCIIQKEYGLPSVNLEFSVQVGAVTRITMQFKGFWIYADIRPIFYNIKALKSHGRRHCCLASGARTLLK